MTSSISIAISSAILRIPSRCGRRSVQISTQMAMCGQKMQLGSFGISQAGERPTVPPFKVAGADESYSLHLHRHVEALATVRYQWKPRRRQIVCQVPRC